MPKVRLGQIDAHALHVEVNIAEIGAEKPRVGYAGAREVPLTKVLGLSG